MMDPSHKENQTFELEVICVEETLNSANAQRYALSLLKRPVHVTILITTFFVQIFQLEKILVEEK